GALDADDSLPGPIYLQGDHTSVKYRNIVIRPVVRPAKLGFVETALGNKAKVESLTVAAELGVKGIQLAVGELDEAGVLEIAKPEVIAAFKQARQESGVEIAALSANPMNKNPAWIPEKRQVALSVGKQSIAACQQLGVPILLVPFFGKADFGNDTDDPRYRDVIELLRELTVHAQSRGITLGIESPTQKPGIDYVLENVNSSHLKVYYDTGNMLRAGEDVYEVIKEWGPKTICQIHLKPFNSEVAEFGKGETDLPRLAESIRESGYKGWLIFEASRGEKTLGTEYVETNLRKLREVFAGEGTTRTDSANESFTSWDTDRSGGLSPKELPSEYRQDIEWADLDGDGELSPLECKKYLATYRRIIDGRKTIPEGTRILEDLEYVQNGHFRHKLDLYLPPPSKLSSDKPLPLVVWVHGGGWKKGTKELLKGQPVVLQHGFALASVNYRLTSHATFPAQIHDCKSAIRFLRKHAAEYNIDPNRIGVWGSSAGGHLVALLGTAGDVAELEGDVGVNGPSSRVQAVCDYFGPTNLITQAQRPEPEGRSAQDSAGATLAKFLGGPISEKTQLAQLASPYRHIDANDPPFLILHGDADPLVPLEQSTSFRDLLNAAEVDCQLTIVPGAGHSFFAEEEHLLSVVDFFSRNLTGNDGMP
ncbi:MAG: alpha/beta fold hydrolase, partial [Planctomycetota bacterium]